MKKVTPKQATIIVKSGISNLFRDIADKKIPNKKNPIKNDIAYCLNVANLYSAKVDFAKDAAAKFNQLSQSVESNVNVDDVTNTAKKDWPDLAKQILG